MTLEEAKVLALNATQERQLNPNYRPTPDEMKAIDLVLIEQARLRLASDAAPLGCVGERL